MTEIVKDAMNVATGYDHLHTFYVHPDAGYAQSQPRGLALSDSLAALAPLCLGILIAAGLVWSVWLGIRVRRREPRPPRPEEQPTLPDDGPVVEVLEQREPEELPRSENGERTLPHELKASGTRTSRRPRRRKWTPGRSGSFGSGNA